MDKKTGGVISASFFVRVHCSQSLDLFFEGPQRFTSWTAIYFELLVRFLFDPRPCILESHGPVKYYFPGLAVLVHTKITGPLKLEMFPSFRVCQRWLNEAIFRDHERFRIDERQKIIAFIRVLMRE